MLKEILYRVKCVTLLMFICHGFQDFASLDCNFEDGLCNWHQETIDDFDWLRKSGSTPSSRTGPSYDHTTGYDGHYIYIEASDQGEGDKAIISSPEQKSGPFCLTFWYNMYGNNIGALNVYMILNGGNITLLLLKDENHGNNDWRKAVINFNAKDTYWIVFVGVRGDGTKGDIAVDDISMIPRLCSLDLASLDCNFEDGLCNWQQADSDDFDWLRESGDTRSSDTGPSSDHTTGDDGHYIYIEASGQNKRVKAVISSPVQESGPYCLTFWYNMYGNEIGALNVYMILNDGNKTLLLTKDENHGNNDWRKAVINNNAMDTYQIVFEGVRGGGSKGDIAVDDISMIHGQCFVDLTTLDCNFEDGLYNWQQVNSDDFDWLRESGDTQSYGTGPSSDHTTGNGWYVYIDSSTRKSGDRAWLMSPLQNAGKYCLSFWYYMYGADVDRLRVLQWYEHWTAKEIFKRIQASGKKWIQENMFLHSTEDFKIIFEGRVKHASYSLHRDEGDIAIDDVHMVSCQDCENPTPEHAYANSTNFPYGSVIEITCNVGYDIIGESLIICQNNSSWSATLPTCNPFDCGHRTLLNGQFSAPEGTTFGKTAAHVCNIGYILVGDTNVTCTDSGWKGTMPACEIIETENDALIAVYILVPVVVVILLVLFIVICFRRRFQKCEKVKEGKPEIRKSPVMAVPNKTYIGVAPESQNHINHAYEDGSVQLNDEYATITDEENVNLNNLYYRRDRPDVTHQHLFI